MKIGDTIKMMVVGDYLIFRNGLRQLLETEPDFKVVGEAADLSTASQLMDTNSLDVVLVNSTEVDRSDASAFFANYGAATPIIVLTHYTDPQVHQKYLLLGASGIITKEQSPEVLFKAIKHVHMDDMWFERKVILNTISRLLEERKDLPKMHSKKYNALTVREWEVLNGVCKGMKNRALAESLFITETTIRHHLTSIFEKLNVKSRLALAILAYNDGVVGVPDGNGGSFFAERLGAQQFDLNFRNL